MTRFAGVLAAGLAVAAVPGGAAQTARLTVVTATDSVTLTADAVAAFPRDTARVRVHESPTIAFAGVQLWRLLARAGYPIDSLRGLRLADYLLVEAADGYRATFSLAELAPDLGGRGALLVDQADGQPLPNEDAPFRLVVPYESRPTRWVRQVTRLRILRAP